MHSPKIFRTGFVLTCFALIASPLIAASSGSLIGEDPHFLSAYHSEYARKLYYDGKNDLAIERLIKAVLLDPQNKTAKEFLKEIAETTPAGQNTQGLKILRFMDQVEYLQFLHERYKNLIVENSKLREFIQKNSRKDAAFEQAASELDKKAQERFGTLPKIDELTAVAEDQTMDLPKVIENLGHKRLFLVTEIGFWEEQNNQLRALKRKVLDGSGLIAGVRPAQKYKTELEQIQQSVTEKDKVLDTQRRNIEYFQSELGAVRDNFSILEEKFKSTDQKITELTKHLAEMSMEIFQKNKMLGQKDEQMVELQRHFSEAQEKINLVQRIIQEKDQRIVSLEKEMAQNKPEAGNGSAVNGMAQMSLEFKNFKNQVQADMAKSRDKVIQLQTQIVELSGEYQNLAKQLKAKDAQISYLHERGQVNDLALGKYRQAFFSSREKVNEINGIVELYRDRLIETQKNLKQKNKELIRLQSRLSQKEPIVDENFDPKSNLDLTISKNVNPTVSPRN